MKAIDSVDEYGLNCNYTLGPERTKMHLAQAEIERLVFRVDEAAAALAISRSKMYYLIQTGAISHIRVGDAIRVPVDALRSFIAGQSVTK